MLCSSRWQAVSPNLLYFDSPTYGLARIQRDSHKFPTILHTILSNKMNVLHFFVCEQIYKTSKRLLKEGSHWFLNFVSTLILLFYFVTQCNRDIFGLKYTAEFLSCNCQVLNFTSIKVKWLVRYNLYELTWPICDLLQRLKPSFFFSCNNAFKKC